MLWSDDWDKNWSFLQVIKASVFLADIKDFEVQKLISNTPETYLRLNILMMKLMMVMMVMTMMNTQAVNEVYKEFFTQDFPARAAIQVGLNIFFFI